MGQGSTRSSREPLVSPSRYPGLRVGQRGEVFSVVHDVLWDEHFAGPFGLTADKAVGLSLERVLGSHAADILQMLTRDAALKEFTVHFREPRRPRSPNQLNSARKQGGEEERVEYIVYGVEVEDSGCCAIPDSILWFVPMHLLGSEKKLSREKYLKEAPQQLLCRCGTYTVESSTFSTQLETLRFLVEKGHRLLHNVVHSTCFSCNVKGVTATSSSAASSNGCSESPEERFLVPVTRPRGMRRPLEETSSSSDSSQSSTALRLHAILVANDPAFSERMKKLLTQCGINCTVCTDGHQAVSFAASEAIGLAIVDVVLAGVSGSEVIGGIAKKKRAIPVLAVAGSPMFSELALTCGATAFLLKNSSPVEAKKMIYSLMTKASVR